MTITEQLTAARKFRHMTARELANRSGIAAPSICQYEHGRVSPTTAIVERIAEAMDMQILIVPKNL